MSDKNQFLIYTAPDGAVKVEVVMKDEMVWLTQKALAELFGVKVPAINKHLKNIFDSGELTREATVSKMEIVHAEGGREVSREMEFYNLDAIIAVGYRVNSHQATQFCIWATKTLHEFIIKGFVMDDERLKRGKQTFGQAFFASEQNMLHLTITGQTEAELIYTTADATKIYIGQMTWKQAPGGILMEMADWVTKELRSFCLPFSLPVYALE